MNNQEFKKVQDIVLFCILNDIGYNEFLEILHENFPDESPVKESIFNALNHDIKSYMRRR